MLRRAAARHGALLAIAATLAALPPAASAAPSCLGLRPTILGTAGRDVLRGTPRADVILARGGADTVFAGAGNDRVCGGSGGDRLVGGDGSDVLHGGGGDDTLEGMRGRDGLLGAAGEDHCFPWTGRGSSSSCAPLVGAAGDIACDPSSDAFNAGAGTPAECRMRATSNLLVGAGLAAVLTLGDNQYQDGRLDDFLGSYDRSWGRVKSITHPALGNHEYGVPGAAGHFAYFGAAAGEPGKGYYAFDVGGWRVIALNSNCGPAGGCGASSAQGKWLSAELAASARPCTLAYWHHPRFSSGHHGSHRAYEAFWNALQAARAEMVLAGHDHSYERFRPLLPDGDRSEDGIRQLVVGTGGRSLYAFEEVVPGSVVREGRTFGVLHLSLGAGSYAWRFVPERGRGFTDGGLGTCR